MDGWIDGDYKQKLWLHVLKPVGLLESYLNSLGLSFCTFKWKVQKSSLHWIVVRVRDNLHKLISTLASFFFLIGKLSTHYLIAKKTFSSVQFSRSVVSDSLRPHESQHARPPCPSQTPGVYSNSCLSSRWCHPAISSSVVPFSSCLQSLAASGSFPMSQLFAQGGQSIGVSASASVLSVNTQDWSPLGWTGWISLQSKGLSRVFSNTHSSKASVLQCSAFFTV